MSKKNDDRKKIKAEAKKDAAELFSLDDQAQLQAKVTELLEESKAQILDLETAVKSAEDDKSKMADQLDDLRNEKEELEKSKAELEASIADLQTKLDESTEQMGELQKKIEDMEQEAAMQVRIRELEDLGLLSSTKADRQKTRIKTMSDDEFAEYKDELLDVVQTREAAKSGEGEPSKSDKPDTKAKAGEGDIDPEAVDADVDLEDDLEADDNKSTTQLSAAKLIELRKARAAAYNAEKSGEKVDEYGVDIELKAEFDKLWDEEGK